MLKFLNPHVQELTWLLTLFPLKTEVCGKQTCNCREISSNRNFFHHLELSTCHQFCSSLPLAFGHPEKKTFTLHCSEMKSLAEGLCKKPCQSSWTSYCWELAEPEVNKQPGYFRMVGRATWTCLFLSPWGKNEHFSCPGWFQAVPTRFLPCVCPRKQRENSKRILITE